MTTMELRPRSVTEIVDAAFEIMRRNYLALITISAVFQLPVLLLQIRMGPDVINPMKLADNIGSFFLLSLADLVARSIAEAAIVVAVSESYLGGKASVVRALGRLFTRGIPLVFVLLVRGIAASIGMIAFIVGMFYIYCRLAVLPAVIVLEPGIGPIAAIDRTWRLTEFRVWDAFLTLALATVVAWAASAVFTVSVQAMGAFVPFFARPSVVMGAARLAAVFVYPFVGAVLTLLYYDLRIRKEAFDMDVMTSALAPRAN